MSKTRMSFIPNPEGINPFVSSSNKGFAESVIARFDCDDTIRFFEELGMVKLNKNGYIYPRSEQASSVLDLLRNRCTELGVDILCGYQPIKIKKLADRGFVIDNDYECEMLVIATGGMNAAKTGSDGSGYEIAKKFGHKIIKPVPALCALHCSDPFFKELAGVRTDAKLTLQIKESGNGAAKKADKSGAKAEKTAAGWTNLMTVSGNLQFNNYGISGIPVFQLSLLASRLLDEKKEIRVKINLLPEFGEEELAGIFAKKKSDKLLGILPKKLANVVYKESKKAHPNEADETYNYVYTHMIQKFKVHPTKAANFEDAQTTLGGVSTDEIDPKTMESRIVKGLYFTGEIMDVSGICGGYNLQWAWATASIAAQAVKK